MSADSSDRAYQVELAVVVRLTVGAHNGEACSYQDTDGLSDDERAGVETAALRACGSDEGYNVALRALAYAASVVRQYCPGAVVRYSPLVGVVDFEEA